MNWLQKKLDSRRRAGVSMGELFLVFLLIVFALALTPTIGDSVAASTGGNITGAAADILALVPLVWVFIVVGIGAAAVVKMFEEIS